MKIFMRFCEVTEKAVNWLVGYMLIVMTILAFGGALARYVFIFSIPWIDEATRYLMVWMTFLVGAIAVGDGSHTSIEVLPAFLDGKFKKFDYRIILDLLIIIGMAVFFYYNLLMVRNAISTGNTTPVLEIPMWIMYCSTLVSALFSIMYCVRNIIVRVERMINARKSEKDDNIC